MWKVDVTEMQEGEFRERLPETDWAWLAGFIDGEGYLGIRRGYGKSKRTKQRKTYTPYKHSEPQDGWVYYSPRLVVNGTHLPSIEKSARMLQGTVRTRKPQPHSVLVLHGVEVSARKKLVLSLPLLIPHMVVKKEEAETLYELVCLPRGTDSTKEKLFQRMVILSQARPGTERYSA